MDLSRLNGIGSKIRSLAFVSSQNPHDNGRYLWVGLQSGAVVSIDVFQQKVVEHGLSKHRSGVDYIFQQKNNEIWTIDQHGILNIWPVIPKEGIRGPVIPKLLSHLITPMLSAAVLVNSMLWTSFDDCISVFRRVKEDVFPLPRLYISKELGGISNLVADPFHKDRIFASHTNGSVSIWCTDSRKNIQVIKLSKHSITAMACIGGRYLWCGYQNGRISIHDTLPMPWITVKEWQAHETSISSISINPEACLKNNPIMKILTSDVDGSFAFWDGLMKQHWKATKIQEHCKSYCDYEDTTILVCSWNADALKPKGLDESDHCEIRAWLRSANKPDIVSIGIQEIVDLSSKRNTARILIKSHTKGDILKDANDQLFHRYKLWYDYLLAAMEEVYGVKSYVAIKTQHLVGLFSCVFVKHEKKFRIKECQATVVKTGLKFMKKSVHGNKGGIAIRFIYNDSPLCFVNCHLAAGQDHVNQRNKDSQDILENARFDSIPFYHTFSDGLDGHQILDHDMCFFSGDLNYRLDTNRDKVLDIISGTDNPAAWEVLEKYDQLNKERKTNPWFPLLSFREAPILFEPTYKYDPRTTNYDSSQKKRVPSWCDRILFRTNEYGPSLDIIYYKRHEVLSSDHRPISAAFNTKTKLIDQHRRSIIAKKVDLEWEDYCYGLVIQKKEKYCKFL
ncbi:Endonuclease/exonuclease/phosphatase [Spinellus fusiger]|nr:Endonuclease/exonuclease/phosphatase [Spinellus fusiger]